MARFGVVFPRFEYTLTVTPIPPVPPTPTPDPVPVVVQTLGIGGYYYPHKIIPPKHLSDFIKPEVNQDLKIRQEQIVTISSKLEFHIYCNIESIDDDFMLIMELG